jgi:two-component system, NarL family, nitrate/nitrite response regulator NarL
MHVLILSDARLYRESLAVVLAAEPDFTVACSSPSHAGVGGRVAGETVDVVLVDATADRALGAVADVAAQAPGASVVVLEVPESEPAVLRFVEAGASAFLPADAPLEDLLDAVRGVGRGESACPPRVTAALLGRLRGLTRERRAAGVSLTAREVEIARLIDEGLSNKEIAARLSIAVPTVKNHVHNILEKLGVRRRSEAAAKVWGTRRSRRSSRPS